MKKNLVYFALIVFSVITFFNCTINNNPPAPPQDFADFFVGNYSGNYRETGVNSGAADHITQTTITKKSANEVLIHLEANSLKKGFDVTGIAKSETTLELPIQTVEGKQLKYVGSGLLTKDISNVEPCDTLGIDQKSKKFLMKFIVKTATDTTKLAFVGVIK
jgi:hypothetical protein